MPRVADGVSSILREGARPIATAAQAFLLSAVAKIRTRSDVMEIPAAWDYGSTVATPYYAATDNWYGSIGTSGEAIPGGETDWRGRVVLSGSNPLTIPSGHTLRGRSGVPSNDQSPNGSDLWAAASFTGGTLLRLGAASYASEGLRPNSTRVEKMCINGRSVAGITGVRSNCIQEASGLFNSAVIGCHNGIVLEAYSDGGSVNYQANNFKFECVHVASGEANQGNGVNVYGGQGNFDTLTIVNTHTTTTGDHAFILRGSGHLARKVHFEGFDYGLVVGGPDSGVGSDNGFWTFNIEVDGLTGYCLSTQPGLKALAWIRDDDTHMMNVSLRNLGVNALYPWAAATAYTLGQRRTISTSTTIMLECTTAGTSHAATEPVAGVAGGTVSDGTVTWTYVYTGIVQDDVNDIVIPASGNALKLQSYEFAGTYGTDSATANPKPVRTSYYDHLCATNSALMGKVLDGTTTQDLDRSFAAGGLAGIVQLRGTAGGSAEELRSLSDPVHGAQVYFHCLDPITLKHNTAGTAALGFHCSTGADISAGRNTFWRVTYGDPRGSATWSGASAFDRWYLEQVA